MSLIENFWAICNKRGEVIIDPDSNQALIYGSRSDARKALRYTDHYGAIRVEKVEVS
jgi:hypothetical protein